MLNDTAKLSEVKGQLKGLYDDGKIDDYQMGMDESIFSYTGSDTRITSILLWTTFSPLQPLVSYWCY